VLLATDPDREGEGIAWQLAVELGAEGGSARVRRVLLGELTPEAVARALLHPAALDRARWEALVARRILDRLVGFRLSARLSSALRPGLTAGRVQAAALRLAAAWRPERPTGGDGHEPGSPPPPPFTTETLLRVAAERLRLRPGRTMRLAQALYQGVELGDGGRTGLVTYPRTVACRISPAADALARALVEERHGPGSAAPPLVSPPPAGGHEALRPTSVDWPPERAQAALREAGGRDLARLYALIWDRFVESRISPACWLALQAAGPRVPRPDPAVLGDAALLALLADHGVGRPSTFASIGESLVGRGYLARHGEGLALTPLGHRVVAWLDRTFPRTLDAAFTRDLEGRLDEVEAGQVPWREAVAAAWAPLERVLADVVA
jgi:DNA topoisomerase-1